MEFFGSFDPPFKFVSVIIELLTVLIKISSFDISKREQRFYKFFIGLSGMEVDVVTQYFLFVPIVIVVVLILVIVGFLFTLWVYSSFFPCFVHSPFHRIFATKPKMFN